MRTMTIQDKTVCVFPGEQPNAPVLYLNTFSEESALILEELHRIKLPDFSLVTIAGLDWNHDMVPWDAPPLFRNAAPCTGGADKYLQLLTKNILPAAEQGLSGVPCWRGLAGYSLAGLFALYALYRTDLFSRVASVSGSLWFPGFREYTVSHKFPRKPDCLYFSLGDKESKTRHPFLRTVRDHTEAIREWYQSQGICTTFVLHPGNHYSHTARRTAAGIAWLLDQPIPASRNS